MNKLLEVLRHLTVILSLMFLVFLILDQFNPMMNFVNNGISLCLLGLLCVCGIAQSVLSWHSSFRHGRAKQQT